MVGLDFGLVHFKEGKVKSRVFEKAVNTQYALLILILSCTGGILVCATRLGDGLVDKVTWCGLASDLVVFSFESNGISRGW